jgi:hypothetical protein
MCANLIEAPVERGCRELVERLLRLRRAAEREQAVCLISGGEFVCPVRGEGRGGRNLEAALRTAVEFARRREEIALRNAIARPILGRSAAGADPRSGHLWVELPKRWTGDTFAEEARRRRVRIASASSFAITRDVPRAVRLSIGAPSSLSDLEQALQILTSIDEESAERPVV